MIDPKEHEKKLIRLYEDEGVTFIKHTGIPGMSSLRYDAGFVEEEEEIVTIKFKHKKVDIEPDEETLSNDESNSNNDGSSTDNIIKD